MELEMGRAVNGGAGGGVALVTPAPSWHAEACHPCVFFDRLRHARKTKKLVGSPPSRVMTRVSADLNRAAVGTWQARLGTQFLADQPTGYEGQQIGLAPGKAVHLLAPCAPPARRRAAINPRIYRFQQFARRQPGGWKRIGRVAI